MQAIILFIEGGLLNDFSDLATFVLVWMAWRQQGIIQALKERIIKLETELEAYIKNV